MKQIYSMKQIIFLMELPVKEFLKVHPVKVCVAFCIGGTPGESVWHFASGVPWVKVCGILHQGVPRVSVCGILHRGYPR